MTTYNKLNFLLLFCLCLLTLSNAEKNWTMGNNTVTILPYETKLTEEQRENYYYWIGLRNSFYYPYDNNQLEKLVKYFTPEEEDYYSNLHDFIIPFAICAGAVIVVLIIYFVRRFILKGCRGPKLIEKSYHNATYFIIGFGFLLGFVSFIFVLYNASHSK